MEKEKEFLSMPTEMFYEEFEFNSEYENIAYNPIREESYMISHFENDLVIFHKLSIEEMFEIAEKRLLDRCSNIEKSKDI